MVRTVCPYVGAVHMAESILSGADAVQQPGPSLPVVGTADESGPTGNRVGDVRAKRLAERRELEQPAIEFMQEEIHTAAYGVQQDVEAGRRKVVGVNEQVEEGRAPRVGQPDYSALEDGQKARLAALKDRRDGHLVREALQRIRDAAGTDVNLMPPIIAAVRAEVTLGEISDVLREVWGTYDA